MDREEVLQKFHWHRWGASKMGSITISKEDMEEYYMLITDFIAENKKLRASCTELTRKLECANLEIERKARIIESYMFQYGTVVGKEVWLKKEREATIQKYREALYRAFAHSSSKDKFNKEVFLEMADLIAKEIVEGEK